MKTFDLCNRCVMDKTDPIITFDDDGMCDHCKDFEYYVKPKWSTCEKGKNELDKIINKIKLPAN